MMTHAPFAEFLEANLIGWRFASPVHPTPLPPLLGHPGADFGCRGILDVVVSVALQEGVV